MPHPPSLFTLKRTQWPYQSTIAGSSPVLRLSLSTIASQIGHYRSILVEASESYTACANWHSNTKLYCTKTIVAQCSVNEYNKIVMCLTGTSNLNLTVEHVQVHICKVYTSCMYSPTYADRSKTVPLVYCVNQELPSLAIFSIVMDLKRCW